MYFSRPTMMPARGAQPLLSDGDIASKYAVDGSGGEAFSSFGKMDTPGRSALAGNASASSTVGRRSTWWAGRPEPFGSAAGVALGPTWASSSGIRRVGS